MFEFGYIWGFILLPLPLLIYLFVPPVRYRGDSLRFTLFNKAAKASVQSPTREARVVRRGVLRWMGILLSWVALITALARPQLVGEPEQQVKSARNFVVAADISFSMATKDWKVGDSRYSRWDGVKEIMGDFLERRDGDKVGLIFFGTHPYLQAPLTDDLEIVQFFLDDADVGMAGQQTSIGKAIGYSVNIFDGDTIDKKVLLLITDGKDSGKGLAPTDAARLAGEDSIKIYTIGIGDPADNTLDEITLRRVAESTGGRYFLAQNKDELTEAYRVLDELEPIEYEETEYKPVTPLYYIPLSLFVGLVVMGLIIHILGMLWKR